MIEEYKFGSITINGKTYTEDVEINWTDDVLDWGRKESHVIGVQDIKRALEQDPETIVIGTGETGTAKVSQEAQEEIQSKGIKLIIDRTEQAAKTFNVINDESEEEEGVQEKVIGLFHLTC